MKVFVTGVAGFLGSYVAEKFRDLGWEVSGIDNLDGGYLSNIPEGVEFTKADCLDRDTYAKHLAGADLVYHCACTAYDGLSVFMPAYVYKNTVQATVEVATASAAAEVPRFVHCSSMARYGAIEAPFREDMTPAPVTPYGLAKYASEMFVKNIFETHGGEYAVAIPHNIIGPRQRFDDPYRNVASIMINRMLRGLQPVIYGDGMQQRCFSFITDVLFCLERMGTSDVAVRETINIGPDEETVTLLGLAEVIAGIMNFELDPIFVPKRTSEVKVATCSSDKARRLLGYQTTTNLRDGLQAIVDWIDRQGPSEFNYHLEIELKKPYTPATWIDKLL
ncbi:MAG TPA: NAD-dependent epimerase/dehydratase family protein [Actinospica sp.]|nr:NAD-dependent epimerase/dehydratase family protein [Actinospica sp.]